MKFFPLRLMGSLLWWLLGAWSGGAAPDAPPNVLFLFVDDMRADSIAALGNADVQTPHLDALVRRGFVMRNAYCLGGNLAAVCTPSRNMLLSGQAYFRWKDFTAPGQNQPGALAPGDAPNFPWSLKAAGYLTYHHGKRGNTAPLIQANFEVNRYLANDLAAREHGEAGREIVDDAIAFLRARKDPRPIFMYLAFANPHDPRVAAPPYLDRYQPARLSLPRNYRPVHPFDNGDMTVRDEKLSPWPRTENEIRRTLHEYYATITALDHHLGRLLQALDEFKMAEQTLVIFASDQGMALGSHGLLGKQNLYENTMKVPLVFAGPGIRPGQSDALVYLLDLYPTVCDLVGAELPGNIDGTSFKPVLQGRTGAARSEIFLSYRDVQRAYRDSRWKLLRYPQVNVTQLFDLETDPDERHDLSSDPAHAGRVRELLEKLQVAQRRFGDEQPLEVAKPKTAAWTPPPPPPPLPTAHTRRDLEGWTVHVDQRLLEGASAELGRRSLRSLSDRLYEITLVVPPEKVTRLRQVPIWLDLTHGQLRPMQYHPNAGWLRENGYATNLVKCVHIPDAGNFADPREQHRQPWAILHELAHAYHDQVLGFDHAEIVAAWRKFKDSSRHQRVLQIGGRDEKPYAATDAKEFFAEMTEAYFGLNDFYPFHRAELKRDEPDLHALLKKIWGPVPGEK